ncbi:MAG: hypothetical protein QNJ00_01635 [Woeseiaceae bacterium]|nr:hypothetical protein [Woeseiaceae bacterium]
MGFGQYGERAVPATSCAPLGASIRVGVADCLASEPAMARVLAGLAGVLSTGAPASLRIADFCPASPPSAQFAALCKTLDGALGRAGRRGRMLTVVVEAGTIDLQAAWQVRCRHLASSDLYAVLPERPPLDVFRQLWTLRHETRFGAASWPVVQSPCALLDAETASDVLPEAALQATAGSAWLHTMIDASELTAARLVEALDTAEAVFEAVAWPTAAMRHDAWLNRRVAVEICGIGDWLIDNSIDPEGHAALVRVDDLLGSAARTLQDHSKSLARSKQLPAIEALDPCRQLRPGELKRTWQRHWRAAVAASALAHRNLLVTSPWSLFAGDHADTRVFNLLPTLSNVDACTFRRRVSVARWNVNDFRGFHGRLRAVLQRSALPSLVAERL